MSEFLLKGIQVVFPGHPLHGKLLDMGVKEGRISQIGEGLAPQSGQVVISYPDLCISPSWIDMRVHGVGMGTEHRETVKSLVAAARNGGFARVVMLPDTSPMLQTENDVRSLQAQYKNENFEVLFLAASFTDETHQHMTEYASLSKLGVKGFTMGNKPCASVKALANAMHYASQLSQCIYEVPVEMSLAGKGQMHEGEISTLLGMLGIPSAAEKLGLIQALEARDYVDGKLHLATLSTKESVELLKEAKRSNQNSSASVAYPNLCLDDSSLLGFDASYKCWPPLRSKEDSRVLVEALIDGTIDFLVSNHHPWDEENKKLEFDLASFGVSSIETLYSAMKTTYPAVNDAVWVEVLAYRTRSFLHLPLPKLEVGEEIDFTLFSPSFTYTYGKENARSMSPYSPFWNSPLKGKALGVLTSTSQYVSPILLPKD